MKNNPPLVFFEDLIFHHDLEESLNNKGGVPIFKSRKQAILAYEYKANPALSRYDSGESIMSIRALDRWGTKNNNPMILRRETVFRE